MRTCALCSENPTDMEYSSPVEHEGRTVMLMDIPICFDCWGGAIGGDEEINARLLEMAKQQGLFDPQQKPLLDVPSV